MFNEEMFVKRLQKERFLREEAERLEREEQERQERERLRRLQEMKEMGYSDSTAHMYDLTLEEIETIEKTIDLMSKNQDDHYSANFLNCIPYKTRNKMLTHVRETAGDSGSDQDDVAYLEGWIKGFVFVWNNLKRRVYDEAGR